MKKIVTIKIAIHSSQADIWNGIKSKKIKTGMSLREIGKVIGIKSPQQIKHHLEQLRKLGTINYKNGDYEF